MSKSISNKSILGTLTVNNKTVPTISYSDSAPTSPIAGDIWVRTTDMVMLTYYGDGTSLQWIEVRKADDVNLAARVVTLETSDTSQNSRLTAVESTASTLSSTKANLAGPTFTGTVVLPSTTSLGNITSTEFGYLDGVTSAIQTQLDGKAASSHNHDASNITSGILDVNRMPAGSVIQAQYYFNSTFNYYNTSSLTDVSSSLRLNFTPKLSNSKMIIICAMNWLHEGTHRQVVRLLRNGTTVGNDMWFSSAITYGWTTAVMNHMWEDSAAHTANTQITYSFQTATSANNMYYNYNFDGQPGSSNYVILEVKT